MKKIFRNFVVASVAVLVVSFAMPVFADCQKKETEIVSGSACSISDLKTLEKNKNMGDEINSMTAKEKDLRPIKLNPKSEDALGDNCLFGMCLYKNILGK